MLLVYIDDIYIYIYIDDIFVKKMEREREIELLVAEVNSSFIILQ